MTARLRGYRGPRSPWNVALLAIRCICSTVQPRLHLCGNTVTHVEDFANNIAYTNITDLATSGFWRLKGEIKPVS